MNSLIVGRHAQHREGPGSRQALRKDPHWTLGDLVPKVDYCPLRAGMLLQGIHGRAAASSTPCTRHWRYSAGIIRNGHTATEVGIHSGLSRAARPRTRPIVGTQKDPKVFKTFGTNGSFGTSGAFLPLARVKARRLSIETSRSREQTALSERVVRSCRWPKLRPGAH